ncbi:hypothetical protein AAMO2058_000379100 [Amorphochlora amoebiformis]
MSEWVDEEECAKEEIEEQEKKEKLKQVDTSNTGYIVVAKVAGPLADRSLGKEKDKVVESAAVSLGTKYSKGQLECLLRQFNWNLNDMLMELKETGGKGMDVSEMKNTEPKRARCVGHIASKKHDEKAIRKFKKTAIYKLVFALMEKGDSDMSIIRACRGTKFPSSSAMKAIQLIRSEIVQGLDLKSSAPCAKTSGICQVSQGAMLACGHFRCSAHWDHLLSSKIKDGTECLVAKCNTLVCTKNHNHSWKEGCFCEERVPREVFCKTVSSPDLLKKYEQLALKNFKDHSRASGLVKCPNLQCGYWWKRQTKTTIDTIFCNCETAFCFLCGLRDHDPLPCDNAKDWQSRSQEDVQTKIWRELNTATCPNEKCGVTIERYITNDDHCLHMVCSQCKYHWCWACRRRFKVGGTDANHDSYYKCRYYQSGSVGKDVEKRERILQESQMYKFYHNREEECEEDINQLKQLSQQLRDEVSKAPDLEFLNDAVKMLITATERKKILNPVAFYSACDAKKTLFEFQLKLMEKQYDYLLTILTKPKATPSEQRAHQKQIQLQLSMEAQKRPQRRHSGLIGLAKTILRSKEAKTPPPAKPNALLKLKLSKSKPVMRSVDQYRENKEKIIEATKSISDFFHKLFKMVREGKLVTILKGPDPENKEWYCRKCQRRNTFGKGVCECAWTDTKTSK